MILQIVNSMETGITHNIVILEIRIFITKYPKIIFRVGVNLHNISLLTSRSLFTHSSYLREALGP